ncbi:thyrotropin-releasing hormone-degrading ectoenzyme [Microplitis demolitor]|uniref:thyrotropin-releasing hormone-degrading ectoenzyme n=1 Tax=Microplitis demolitor TaxID=69319 RepID=UPI0006D4FE75|nr:thyrotropin-releasing hormone-degrading ectoenzyme [Microplitis demolitor]
MVATHFQPAAARRAFPCWDEPAFKAEFEISLKHYPNYTALSNMPVKNHIETTDGKIWTNFEKSPPMSTYLVSFVIADYEHVANNVGNITFWTKKDHKDDVRLAFEISQAALIALEKYTGIPYSLPKLDQVTIPQYSSVATEHWGIISYFTYGVYFNLNESSILTRDNAIQLTIHEVSHQWFGNLVTPAWWNDLWLSEAFVVYFSAKIADQILNDWYGRDLFVVDIMHKISFPAELSIRNPRPIRWNPDNRSEVSEIFNKVTYRKGAAIVYMIENILSEDVFRDGIRRYLQKHQFSTVTTNDLWQALQESYDVSRLFPILNIKEIMDPWVEQTGYPILNVTRDYETGITNITQSNGMPANPDNLWMVPLTFTDSSKLNFNHTRPTHWLAQSRENLTIYGIHKDDWVIFNIQQSGFYRVNYDHENWKRIADYLHTNNFYKIDAKNRAQFIDDLYYFADIDDQYYEILIDVISYLYRETNYLPWIPTLEIIEKFNGLLMNTPSYNIFEKFMLHLLNNIVEYVGFENNKNENHLVQLARHHLLPWACAFGHEECRSVARDKVTAHLENPSSNVIAPNDESWIYCNGLRASNESIWENFMNAHLANPLEQPGFQYLGCTENRHLIEKYLLLAIADNSTLLTDQVSNAFISIMSGKRENVDFALDFFINNIEKIRKYHDVRDMSNQIEWIAEKFSESIKNPDQYNKFLEFVTSQEDQGKMSSTNTLLKQARNTMASSEKISSIFHALIDSKPSLFNLIHGPLYSNNK